MTAATSRPLRVAFVAPFPASAVLAPQHVKPKYQNREHPAPWVGLLAEALARRGDTIVHVFVDSRAVTQLHHASWRGAHVTLTPKVEPLRSDPLHLFLPGQRRLAGPIRDFGPDIVIGFGAENGSALIASRLPYPSVMFVQGIQAYTTRFQNVSAAYRAIALALERRAVRNVDAVIGETGFALDWARAYRDPASIRVIPHPLTPAFLDAPAGHRDPLVLCVGTLHHLKGIDTVIRAFAATSMPPARLWIAGRGPDGRRLHQLAHALGIGQRIRFLGHVPPDRVRELMAEARLLVTGSRVDTAPNTVTEAHASAMPVVATRAGGIPDMVNDGVDGYLVDIDDHQAMAARLQILLEDADLALHMAVAGREKVRRMNDPDGVAALHRAFYADILKRGAQEVSPCAA